MNAIRNFGGCATPMNLVIAHSSPACLKDARGLRLSVQRGYVWITQSGSTADVCLDAGESFLVTRNGKTLISACGRSSSAVVTFNGSVPGTPTLGGRLRKFCNAIAALSFRPAKAAV